MKISKVSKVILDDAKRLEMMFNAEKRGVKILDVPNW
jgi:hypothetical protein